MIETRKNPAGDHGRGGLLMELDEALAETNAPVQSGGPTILQLGGLIIKELLHLGPRRPPMGGSHSNPEHVP